MANKEEVEFIGAEEFKGGQEIPFSFIIGRILINLDAARFTGNDDAYLRGIKTLINRCWHLIDRENSEYKKQLDGIDSKYNKLSNGKSDVEQEAMVMERAEEIDRMMMKLLYVSGEVSSDFLEE